MVTDSTVQALIGHYAQLVSLQSAFNSDCSTSHLFKAKHAECCPQVHTSFDQNLLGFVLKQV